MKVYGPYEGKDGRLRCVIVHDNGQKQTVSYPRLLLEEYLGTTIPEHLDVHHIDGNPLNNNISNLEIVDKREHVSSHSKIYKENVEVFCYYCNSAFTLNPKQQSQRARSSRKGKAGPFCSRECSGKYGSEIQKST